MTSPVITLSEFRGKFKIPNDDDKILKILVKNPDLGKSIKGKREIFLYEESICINHSSDEMIYSPTFEVEFDGEDVPLLDNDIIESFHSDDVEFI